MRSFEATGPVSVTVRNASGEVLVTTTDGPTADVDVTPMRDDESSREAAESTRVEYDGGALRIDVPHKSGFLTRDPKVRVEVKVPHGSSLEFTTASADVRAHGRYGDVRGRTASGDVTVGDAATVRVETASGDLAIGDVAGDAALKSVSGDIRVATVGGTLDAGVVSGDVKVGSAARGASATAVSGDIELDSVTEGDVAIKSVSGDVTVGVRQGSRVHVDVTTVSGDLRSDLPLDDAAPGGDGPMVDIRGRTVSGDLRVRRAASV